MEEDNDNENKDTVILEIEGNEVICEKKVLIKNSDYFSAMFGGNFIESSSKKIRIKDLTFKSFKCILSLLQDEGYMIGDCDLHLVLQAAYMLQFNSIKLFCESRIIELMNPLICLKIWKTAETLNLEHIWLKAKYMALGEFNSICNSTDILELSLEDVCLYLGHVHLNTKSEMIVFQTAMNWWHENNTKFDGSEHTKILLHLINCLDINRLHLNDMKKIQQYPAIVANETILLLIQCVIDLKIGIEKVYPEIISTYAKHLFQSVERTRSEMPCLLLDDGADTKPKKKKRKYYPRGKGIMVYDPKSLSFREGFFIKKDLIEKFTGYHILSFKEFTFFYGGENLIGGGKWNLDLWVHDEINEKWEIKSQLPYPRRHFQSTFVGDNLFIVGGVGKFRVHQENIFWYNVKGGVWSRKVELPTSARTVKCCCFQKQLLVVYFTEKKAFFYNIDIGEWRLINIMIEKEVIDVMGEIAIFTSLETLYVKEQAAKKRWKSLRDVI